MGLVEGLELEVAGAAKDWRDLIRLHIEEIAIVEVVVLEASEDGDLTVAEDSDCCLLALDWLARLDESVPSEAVEQVEKLDRRRVPTATDQAPKHIQAVPVSDARVQESRLVELWPLLLSKAADIENGHFSGWLIFVLLKTSSYVYEFSQVHSQRES